MSIKAKRIVDTVIIEMDISVAEDLANVLGFVRTNSRDADIQRNVYHNTLDNLYWDMTDEYGDLGVRTQTIGKGIASKVVVRDRITGAEIPNAQVSIEDARWSLDKKRWV